MRFSRFTWSLNAALDSVGHALQIRLKLFGEQQERTADNFDGLALTPPSIGDLEGVTESGKFAPPIPD